MRIDELPPRGRSRNHRDTKEHIDYILEDKGYSLMHDERYEWEEGDVFLGSRWARRQYWNTSSDQYARYLVATSTPMVRVLGFDQAEYKGQ